MKIHHLFPAIISAVVSNPLTSVADVALLSLKTGADTPRNIVTANLDADGRTDFIIAGARPANNSTLKRLNDRGDQVIWEINAPANASDLGHGIVVVGDTDNDGVKDLVVTAPNISRSTLPGKVFIISGRTGAILRDAEDFIPNVPGNKLGESVAKLNDDSVVVCGSGNTNIGATCPATCFEVRTASAWGRWGFQREAGAGYGSSMTVIGDLNNDGKNEIAIAEPNWTRTAQGTTPAAYWAGRIEIVSGQDGSVLRTIEGAQYAKLGHKLSTISDLNSDGRPELLAVSGGVTAAHNKVEIFSITANGVVRIREHVADASYMSSFGQSSAGIGDQNGDLVDDYAVSQPLFQNQAGAVGRVRVFSGLTGRLLHDIVGKNASYNFGMIVNVVNDITDDGKKDLVIASANGPLQAGVATVFSTDNFARIPMMACGDGAEEKMSLAAPKALILNSTLTLTANNAGPTGNYVVFLVGEVAGNYGSTSVMGCASPINIFGYDGTWHLELFQAADAAGLARINLAIPNDTALPGQRIVVQALTFNSKGVLLTTEAVAMKIG
jgi:hypothetical protein